MITGTYLKIPETGDRGTIAHPGISNNFSILDAHTHDGVTSPLMNTKNLQKDVISLLTAGWILDASGDYKQEVTLSTGRSFNNSILKFILASGPNVGSEFHPTIIKTDTNKFNVIVYTNTIDVDVVVC